MKIVKIEVSVAEDLALIHLENGQAVPVLAYLGTIKEWAYEIENGFNDHHHYKSMPSEEAVKDLGDDAVTVYKLNKENQR